MNLGGQPQRAVTELCGVNWVLLVDQEWLKLGVPLLCLKGLQLTTVSQNDDDFEELAQGQPKNAKLSNKSTVSGLRHVGSIWMSLTLPKMSVYIYPVMLLVEKCGHILIQDEAKHYINQVVIILLYQCTYNIYVG